MNIEAIKRFFPKTRVPAALLAGLALLFLLHSGGRVVRLEWMAILLWLVPPTLLIWASKSYWNRTLHPESRNTIPLLAVFAFLVLYLFSSAVFSRWFYFPHWAPSGPDYLRSGIEHVVLLTALLAPALLLTRNRHRLFLYLAFAAGVLLCAYALYSATGGGKALWRDDHPSFLFRLWVFGKTFPQLLNYNPYWNGGASDFVCTTTGTNAFGLLFWPLWKYFPPHLFYTAAVAIVFLLLVPLLTALAVRVSGGDRTAAAVAALLGLGVSQHFFLWMLHFGTIGAALASSFVLPVSAALYRVFWMDRREIWTGVFLVLSVLFLILWPAGAIMLAPIALGAVVNFRRWTRKKILFLAVCGLAVLILYFRPLTLILFEKSSPLSFVMSDQAAAPSLFTLEVLKRGWKHFLAHLVEGHPVLLFLGIGGLVALPHKSIRRWYGPIFIGFALLTGWGREWKPEMQLTRMAIPMLFVAVAPAAILCSRLLRTRDARLVLVRAALIALLFYGGYGVSRIYANKGMSRFTALSEQVEQMTEWIKINTPPDGRVLFAGRMVHAVNGGHVAYLPVLTGREMMACDYYHFPPKTVEYEYPPRPFNMNPEGIHRFMDLYNVSCVITYHDRWKEFYRHFPDRYEEAQTTEPFTFFKVKRAMNFFLQGSGTVAADFSRIDVQLDSSTNDVVIKYNWVDGLKAAPPAEIYAYDAGSKVSLIGIKPNGANPVRITF